MNADHAEAWALLGHELLCSLAGKNLGGAVRCLGIWKVLIGIEMDFILEVLCDSINQEKAGKISADVPTTAPPLTKMLSWMRSTTELVITTLLMLGTLEAASRIVVVPKTAGSINAFL